MYYIISPSEKSKKHPPGCQVNIQGSLISSAECRRRAPGQRAWPRKPVRVKRTQQGQLPAFLGCCAGDSISAVVSSIRSTWRQATKIHFLLSLSIPAITSPFIRQLAITVLSANSRVVHHINFFLTRSAPSAKTDCPSRDCPSCLVSNNVFSASFEPRVGWYRKGLAISLSFLWCFHQSRRM